MDMSTLRDMALEIMADLNIDQAGLARLAEVTQASVSQWLHGPTKTMAPGPAFAIQRKSGWSAEYLLTGKGPKKMDQIRERDAEYVIERRIAAGELLDMRDICDEQRSICRRVLDAISQPDAKTGSGAK